MSTLATNAITDASGGNTATINGYTPTLSNMAGRNRIINGDMRVSQRYGGAEVNPVANATYGACDRFMYWSSQTSKFKAQQNAGGVTPPQGFSNYLGLTSLSAYTLNSTDYFQIQQTIEGYNWADLSWGTANAQTATLSFWVRSSLTGTFGGIILSKTLDYNYPFTYTIPTANTWVKIELTITPPTTGTWDTTNYGAATVVFSIGHGSTRQATAGVWTTDSNIRTCTGQTNVVGTNGATFYITGIQFEAGSVATPFEHVDYGEMLRRCQRYFWNQTKDGTGSQNPIGTGWMRSSTLGICTIRYPVPMRTTPAFTSASGSAYFHISTVTDYDVTSLFVEGSNYISPKTASIAGIIASGSDVGGA